MKRLIIAASVALVSATAANAYDDRANDTSDIDARRASELRRIEQGFRTGQLSWREYNHLRLEQAQIGQHERAAKADGYVSPQERRRLNGELNQASADIERLKHNDEVGRRRY